MNKLSNGRKVIIFTVLLITAFILSNYGESGAKYYKIENDSITYNLGFDALTKDGLGSFALLYDKSEHTIAYFRYTVPRNTIMNSLDTNDNYEVSVNSGCEIKKVNGNTVTSASNVTTISYLDNTSSDIVIEYSCLVENLLITNSTDSFDTDIVIYEQMTTDYKKFIYIKQESDLYKISQNLPAEIVGDYHVLTILDSDDEDTINSKITDWILVNISKYSETNQDAYSTLITNAKVISSYLQNAYSDDIRNFDESLIRGITFEHVGDTYTYTMSEDLLGYALTDARTLTNTNYYVFWFADVDKTDAELEEIFEYYVDKYLYSKDTSDYTTLMNYINSNGGISAWINGTADTTYINYSKGRLRIRTTILDNIPQTTSIISDIITSSINTVTSIQTIIETNIVSESIENIIVNKILTDYAELISTDNINEFIKVDKDLIITNNDEIILNDYIIYNIDGVSLLINIYTDEEGIINTTVVPFDENVEIDLSTATKLSIATEYADEYDLIIEKYNSIASIIDSKYETKYTDIITVEDLNNYEVGNGLYIYEENNIIKVYLINKNDEYSLGTVITDDDEVIDGETVDIITDPDKVIAGDTPNDDIPIFDDLTTTEPGVEVTDTVTGDNETVDENPETQEEEEDEKTEEVDENSKVADTDIEKEFIEDIEEVEKFIEEVKDYVGDAQEVSEEEEAIEEVSELIETVKDYINEV